MAASWARTARWALAPMPPQDDEVVGHAFEAGREVLEVVIALDQKDRRATVFQRANHVVQDQLVPCQCGVIT